MNQAWLDLLAMASWGPKEISPLRTLSPFWLKLPLVFLTLTATIGVGIACLDPTAACLNAPSYSLESCAGLPEISAELNESFEVVVTYCPVDPTDTDAAALIEMVYATRGGNLTDQSNYGRDEVRVIFNVSQNQATAQIDGITGGTKQVVGAMVTASRTSGASPEARVIGSPIQLQRFEQPQDQGDTGLSMILTPEMSALMESDLMRRNLVHPAGHPNSCARAFADWDISTVDNRSRDSLRVVHAAKVICAMSYTNIPPTSCNDNGLPLVAAVATHCASMAAAATPETCNLLHSRSVALTQYLFCCDPQTSTNRSLVAMQTSRSVVTEKVLADGSARILDPFYWAEVKSDIQPSGDGTLPSSAVTFAWFDFAGSSPTLDTAEDCNAGALVEPFPDLQDADGDGIFDGCDYLVSSETDQAGGNDVLLRRHFRNADFNDLGETFDDSTGFTSVPLVRIQGQDISSIAGTIDDLTITIPPALPLGVSKIEVCPNSGCASPGISRDDFFIRRRAYIAMESSDFIRPFDEATGEFVDIDAKFTNAVPDVPIAGVTSALFTIEPGNEGKEVLIGAGELFVYDDPNGVLKDLGAQAGIQGAALGVDINQVVLEPDGEFAFAFHNQNRLGAIQVRRSGLVEADRFASYPSLVSYVGEPSQMAVQRVDLPPDFANPDAAPYGFVVYTTTSCAPDCDFGTGGPCPSSGGGMSAPMSSPLVPIIPCVPEAGNDCGGGGGGGGSGTNARSVALEIRIVRPVLENGVGPLLEPTYPWQVECIDNIELSRLDNAQGPTWDRLGLDFNTSRTELFIVNPDTDSVFILNTTSNELEPIGSTNSNPLQIPVGVEPFAIEILQVKDAFGLDVDRAYVANNGDDTMTIVDTAGRQSATLLPRNLQVDFPGLTDIRVEFMAGSEVTKNLFLVSPNTQRLLWYAQVKPGDPAVHGDAPDPQPSFVVGPEPGNVALKP